MVLSSHVVPVAHASRAGVEKHHTPCTRIPPHACPRAAAIITFTRPMTPPGRGLCLKLAARAGPASPPPPVLQPAATTDGATRGAPGLAHARCPHVRSHLAWPRALLTRVRAAGWQTPPPSPPATTPPPSPPPYPPPVRRPPPSPPSQRRVPDRRLVCMCMSHGNPRARAEPLPRCCVQATTLRGTGRVRRRAGGGGGSGGGGPRSGPLAG